MADQLPRNRVPSELTWNLNDIYASADEWETDLKRVEAALPSLSAYRGRLGEGASILLALFKARDVVAELFEKVSAYAGLSLAVDGASAHNQAMQARVSSLTAKIGAELSFVANELLALPEGVVEFYLDAEEELAPFRPQLEEMLRRRGHMLVPEAEQALAALGETLGLPGTVWQRVTAADVTCAPVDDGTGQQTPVSIARWQFGFSRSPDRDLCRRAFESLSAGLGNHKHTLATTLAAFIKRNVALARLRGYDSAVEMILAPEQVPERVYRTLLDVVHDGMAPHVRRLMQVRRRVLGLDEMHYFDIQAPLDPTFNRPVTFEEAGRSIRTALGVLGDEYSAIIETAFRDRWIDRADNIGKRSGAFSSNVFGVHPYVFTTWQEQLRSALILAHELGHAGNFMLASRNQIISNTRSGGSAAFTGLPPSLFFVEAPSTANEVLVGRHMLDTAADPRLRRFIVEQFMDTFTHNMVTHLLEAHFEQRLYDLAEAEQPITTTTVMDVQADVFSRFFGDTVVLDDGARLYWAQQPHFYRGLYSYTYSSGLACGFNVVENIREQGWPAVERWLDTLRAGSTLPPLELAQSAGIDMTRPEPLRRVIDYFGTLVDELEASFS